MTCSNYRRNLCFGLKDAWVFGTWWLPFCRKYNIRQPCPLAYFQQPKEERQSCVFKEDRQLVEEKYEIFEQRVQSKRYGREFHEDARRTSRDYSALVQVIDGSGHNPASLNQEPVELPRLVYVAREKRQSHPHHFKAGALNVLLRVSSILSNSPCILVLDCDMYCNDTISARQAMCLFLDSKISSSLGWVQFPQKFHNVSESDIYDSQFRKSWTVYYPGTNGFYGPLLCGTNFYINRKALYGADIGKGYDLKELRESLGPSNELLRSLSENGKPNFNYCREFSSVSKQAHFLASCIFEKDTKWGEKVGFWYNTVIEDIRTALFLQSKGWRSVFLNPSRPQFLGSATTNFSDIFTQTIRWYSGFADIALSKYCPLIYSPSKLRFSEKMMYTCYFIEAFNFLPVMCSAAILPMCFLYGIPVYPQVTDPYFMAFAFTLLSFWMKHLSNTVISGGSVSTWLKEERLWLIKSMTSHLYGTLECVITRLGYRDASFTPTNKAGGEEATKWYLMGKYDFRTSNNMFLVPLVTAVTLNTCCSIGGIATLLVSRSLSSMFAAMVWSLYVLLLSLPVIEGMLLRKDNGRVPLPTTLMSATLSLVLMSLGYLFLMY